MYRAAETVRVNDPYGKKFPERLYILLQQYAPDLPVAGLEEANLVPLFSDHSTDDEGDSGDKDMHSHSTTKGSVVEKVCLMQLLDASFFTYCSQSQDVPAKSPSPLHPCQDDAQNYDGRQ